MNAKKNTILKGLVDKQKLIKTKNVSTVNLEALVNSGRVRIKKDELIEVLDNSKNRKKS